MEQVLSGLYIEWCFGSVSKCLNFDFMDVCLHKFGVLNKSLIFMVK